MMTTARQTAARLWRKRKNAIGFLLVALLFPVVVAMVGPLWLEAGPTFGFMRGEFAYIQMLVVSVLSVAIVSPISILIGICLSHGLPKPRHCFHCSYDLTGNECTRCPACGEAVE